ncbi:MAG: hypothetical protein WBB31_08105, partial [Saprospiraceae bacterium]
NPYGPLFQGSETGEDLLSQSSTPVQLWQRYILLPGLSDLVIIDQRAAHERVIFESMMKDLAIHNPAIQKLLWPETIQSHASDTMLLKELLPHLQYLGFDIAEFGHGSFIVHGIPAIITDLISPQQAIDDVLDRFKSGHDTPDMKPVEKIAFALASNLSRKRGDAMTTEEMQMLVEELMASENPYTSPSGRKTFITIPKDEMSRRFQS